MGDLPQEVAGWVKQTGKAASQRRARFPIQTSHQAPSPLSQARPGPLTRLPAAKQAAFEEQARLKNQFRPLDDDEVDFLTEVRESRLADEEQLRRETEAGLRHFREAQLEAMREVEADGGDGGDDGAGDVPVLLLRP